MVALKSLSGHSQTLLPNNFHHNLKVELKIEILLSGSSQRTKSAESSI